MGKAVVIVIIGIILALSFSSGALSRVVVGFYGFPYYPYPYAYYPFGYPYYYPYFYGYPYYPSYTYPSYTYSPPATVYVEPEQPFYWYFCRDSQTYYPYVTSCPGGWIKVIPAPPNAEKEGTAK